MQLSSKHHYSLRPIVEDDLETVLQWRNSERIRAMMCSDHIISQEEHFAWYQKIKNTGVSTCLIFTIQQIPYGLINFSSIDLLSNHSSLGYYLGRTDEKKGRGSIMLFLALDYIFLDKKLRKLCSQVLDFNAISIHLHKKFGFYEEGCLKQHIFKNNEYHDVIQFALFKEKWLEHRKGLEANLF